MARGPHLHAGDPLRAVAALAVLGYHAAHAAASRTGHPDLVDGFGAVGGRLLAAIAAGSLWLRASHVYVDGWQHAFRATVFAFAPGIALAGLEARGLPRVPATGAWVAAGVALLVAVAWVPVALRLRGRPAREPAPAPVAA